MRSLTFKVALACLAASLLGIGLVAILAAQNTTREFGSFVFEGRSLAFETNLLDYYATHGSWDGVKLAPVPEATPSAARDSNFGRGGLTLADASGRVVIAGEGYQVGQQLAASEMSGGHVLEYDGQVVGTLIPVPNAPGYGGAAGLAFLTRINRALLLGAGGAAAAALIIGVLFARALTQPLKALTRASHAIADGDLEQQVQVRSGDEIGELSAAFNRMSADLAQASHLRRQMTADIAHDLRTPLTMILAHSEALRDGVLPPTAETYTLIHDEALRLSRLVEDLRTLSLADAGELSLARRPTSPEALLAQAVAAQAVRAQQQQVQVEIETPAGLPAIQADPDRMVQVLGNLLDNALRYMPAGGQLDCRVALDGSSAERPVVFRIGDSGPGIAPQDLPHVFERFYRADKARQRDASGSGLGLAIARSIVEAHGGRIWVESELGKGAQFFVAMPRMAGLAR